jgi:uncharacterized RDD family membrane protein YckC
MIQTVPLPGGAIGAALMEDDFLSRGVLLRRYAAWWIDLLLIGLIDIGLWLGIATFGLVTLGLGWAMMPVLGAVPFLYHWLFLSSGMSATPGQSLMGLVVARNADLARPDWVEAGVWTLLYYLTLAVFFPLLLVALFTTRKRALHDILSGLVVIRKRALTQPVGYWNMPK